MENLKYIFISDNYLNNLSEEIKANNDKLYKHLIETDLSNYIDKEKVKSNFNTELYTLAIPKSLIDNKYIFAQINKDKHKYITFI